MLNIDQLYELGHLIFALEELSIKLESFFSQKNHEKIESTKREILRIQEKIEEILK